MHSRLICLLLLLLSACAPVDVLNSLVSRDDYRIEQDIPYGPDPRQKLDLYLPKTINANTPVVVFFYGGRWEEGNKGQYLFAAAGLAEMGYIVAVPDYRVYPQIKYPVFIEDSAKAVVWVYKHIDDYGGNAENLYLIGHSAGAYNVAMLALDTSYLAKAGGNTGWIRGVVGLAGPYDFLPLTDADLVDLFSPAHDLRTTQPISYVRPHAPPMLLLAGSDDDVVKLKNSRNLYAALKQNGDDATYKEYPGIGHIGLVLALSPTIGGNEQIKRDIRAFIGPAPSK